MCMYKFLIQNKDLLEWLYIDIVFKNNFWYVLDIEKGTFKRFTNTKQVFEYLLNQYFTNTVLVKLINAFKDDDTTLLVIQLDIFYANMYLLRNLIK